MWRELIIVSCFFSLLNLGSAYGESTDKIAEAIKAADKARGLSPSPISYPFEVEIFSADEPASVKKYDLVSHKTLAVATLTFPQKPFKEAVVAHGTMVWIARENSRRPTLVSLNERMSGAASVGDIMAMYFGENFKIEATEPDKESMHTRKITLRPTAAMVAYEKVIIWLDTKAKLIRKAEYHSVNGESLKQVDFSYDHSYPQAISKGKEPLISKMVFKESSDAPAAIVTFGTPKTVQLPKEYFELESVVERLKAPKK